MDVNLGAERAAKNNIEIPRERIEFEHVRHIKKPQNQVANFME